MNTMQHTNAYDTASHNLGLGVADMISSGMYKLVQVIERTIRAI